MNLAYRILDCFPAGSYALAAFLRLCDIVATGEVPTAAVECRAEPRLLVNPAFVDRHAPTPEKLLMLVLHELHHVLLGHCRLFPRVTKVDNLVFDAVINALLCRMCPGPEHTSFFTDYYRDDIFPDCLLRPPIGWPCKESLLPPALHEPSLKGAADVYLALYSPTGASYHDLYDVLRSLLTEALVASVPLLGDHRDEDGEQASSAGALEERSPVLFDIVRQIVERWPQPPDPIAGRSLADLLRAEEVTLRPRPGNRALLRGLFRRLAREEGRGRGTPRLVRDERLILTPLPTFDRRSVVLAALGCPPLLHTASLEQPARRPRAHKVHVYLDVSGSIGSLKGELYSAVLDCKDLVYSRVHLFSTAVVDVSLEELRKGKCETTGGTDIRCVARHLRDGGITRAAIITDGFVGKPAGQDRETLGRAKLGVALTPGASTRADLDGLVREWVQLGEGR